MKKEILALLASILAVCLVLGQFLRCAAPSGIITAPTGENS